MKIILNGKELEFSEKINLISLLENLALDSRKIAVERNLEIVSKSNYQFTDLNDGDRLEIIHFVGGG